METLIPTLDCVFFLGCMRSLRKHEVGNSGRGSGDASSITDLIVIEAKVHALNE